MMANQLQRAHRFTVSSAVHARQFDEELIILDLAAGAYFALDTIGTRAWESFAQGKSVEETAAEFSREYEVEFDRALADLLKLSEELVSRGLLILAPAGVA
jgi:hypothetical protein